MGKKAAKPAYSIQKPGAQGPKEVEAKPSAEPKAKPKAQPQANKNMARPDRGGRLLARLTVWLPDEGVRALKRQALDQRTTVQAILTGLVDDWTSKRQDV